MTPSREMCSPATIFRMMVLLQVAARAKRGVLYQRVERPGAVSTAKAGTIGPGCSQSMASAADGRPGGRRWAYPAAGALLPVPDGPDRTVTGVTCRGLRPSSGQSIRKPRRTQKVGRRAGGGK